MYKSFKSFEPSCEFLTHILHLPGSWSDVICMKFLEQRNETESPGRKTADYRKLKVFMAFQAYELHCV